MRVALVGLSYDRDHVGKTISFVRKSEKT